MINYSRWNREGDNLLNYSSYTTIDWWGMVFPQYPSGNFSFNTNPGKTFYLVTEFQGMQTTYSFTIPDGDNDGDGVLNGQDDCPNEAGPASNNGCPEEPDFVITAISIDVENGPSTSTPNTLAIRSNEYHSFCFTIENQGAGMGEVDDIEIILANNSDLLNANYVANLPVLHINEDIGPSQSIEKCLNDVYLNDPYLGFSLSSLTYIHALLNSYDDETNTNNNDVVANISTTAGRNYPKTITNLNTMSRNTVNSKEEEKQVLKSLKKGFYVIKDKNGKIKKIIN